MLTLVSLLGHAALRITAAVTLVCFVVQTVPARAQDGIFKVLDAHGQVAVSSGDDTRALRIVCDDDAPVLRVRFAPEHASDDYLRGLPAQALPLETYVAYLNRNGQSNQDPFQIRVVLEREGDTLLFYAWDKFHIGYGLDGRLAWFIATLEDVTVITAQGRLPSLSGNWGVSKGWATSTALVDVARLARDFPEYDSIAVSISNPDRGVLLQRRIPLVSDDPGRAMSRATIDTFLDACTGPSAPPTDGASSILR